MSFIKNVKYPTLINPNKRVYYRFNSFISFFERNRKSIQSVKINPPKIGSSNFGSIEVKVKQKIKDA